MEKYERLVTTCRNKNKFAYENGREGFWLAKVVEGFRL